MPSVAIFSPNGPSPAPLAAPYSPMSTATSRHRCRTAGEVSRQGEMGRVSAAQGPGGPPPKLNTVIVESRADIRAMLAERLPRLAPVAIQQATALDAVDIPTAGAVPDLVLIEPRPDLGKAERLISRFAALPRPPHVIVFTSYLQEEEQRRLRAAGATAFVMKDPRLLNLLAAIQSARLPPAP